MASGWLFGTPLPGRFPAHPQPRPVDRHHREAQRPGASLGGSLIDFGFDIGGPIIKNRLFFYAGFAPNYNRYDYQRILRARTDKLYDPTVIGPAPTPTPTPATPTAPSPATQWLAAANPALCALQVDRLPHRDIDSRYWRQLQLKSLWLYQGMARSACASTTTTR